MRKIFRQGVNSEFQDFNISKDFDGFRETSLKSNGLQNYHGTSKDFFDSDGLQTRSLSCFPLVMCIFQ